MDELPQDSEIKVPKPVAAILFIIPFAAIVLAWYAASGPRPDPTVNFFKQWLNTAPATNPLAYHAPYRDDNELVYVSNQETDVRAAMDGMISVVDNHSVKLSSPKSEGAPLTAYYYGLSTVAVGDGEPVHCGAKIGTMDGKLRVRFMVDGESRLPPESLTPLPRALQDFADSSSPGHSHPHSDKPVN